MSDIYIWYRFRTFVIAPGRYNTLQQNHLQFIIREWLKEFEQFSFPNQARILNPYSYRLNSYSHPPISLISVLDTNLELVQVEKLGIL